MTAVPGGVMPRPDRGVRAALWALGLALAGLVLSAAAHPAGAAGATAAADPGAAKPVDLAAFGTVLWSQRVVLGPHQDLFIGDQFMGPGTAADFGVVAGRFHDRLFFRTERKILREWSLPAAGMPDSAVAWARLVTARFAAGDTLFVEFQQGVDPLFATDGKAVRLKALFKRWVAQAFTPADWTEAASLGVAAERLMGPPPERICPIGSG